MVERKNGQGARTPLLEWVAAGAGFLFLICLLAAIGHDAITGSSQQPPSIAVLPGEIIATPSSYVVPFKASNGSGGTAAAVQIEGKLEVGSMIETSQATIDYIAGQSTGEGSLIFTSDPRQGRLTLRVTGYQKP